MLMEFEEKSEKARNAPFLKVVLRGEIWIIFNYIFCVFFKRLRVFQNLLWITFFCTKTTITLIIPVFGKCRGFIWKVTIMPSSFIQNL